jgi:hypothetical protein
LLLFGIRVFDNGLKNVRADGIYTEYIGGKEVVYDKLYEPLFAHRGYARLDIVGGEAAAGAVLDDLKASVLWRESFDNTEVIYAYSKNLSLYKIVKDTKINLMIAVSASGGVSVGYPLLKGSY